MPLYQYACRSCTNEFTQLHKVDDRNIPTETPCANCQGEIYIKIGSSHISNKSDQLNYKKVPQDFKDLVKGIKKAHNQEYTE
ncbi:FmdB family regulatory protein [Acinetobacter phage SH-Ab 15599]|nr:FmdB family regulatory protein [Acinetobacter phage SH-Ab 15599]